jgi:hypothetical protein
MAQVISIRSPEQIPETKSELYGIQVQKYYADGVISVIRTRPGEKIPDSPTWFQVGDDGTLKKTHIRIISTEVRDENVTRFWFLDDKRELHKYLSPKSCEGTFEIRERE